MLKPIFFTLCLFPLTAWANEPCFLTSDNSSVIKGSFESINKVSKRVFPVGNEGVFKCVVTVRATVKGKSVRGHGTYTYNPDQTQEFGCNKAFETAKVNILRRFHTEDFKSKVVQKCDTRKKWEGQNRIVETYSTLPWIKPKFIGERK